MRAPESVYEGAYRLQACQEEIYDHVQASYVGRQPWLLVSRDSGLPC